MCRLTPAGTPGRWAAEIAAVCWPGLLCLASSGWSGCTVLDARGWPGHHMNCRTGAGRRHLFVKQMQAAAAVCADKVCPASSFDLDGASAAAWCLPLACITSSGEHTMVSLSAGRCRHYHLSLDASVRIMTYQNCLQVRGFCSSTAAAVHGAVPGSWLTCVSKAV
jgi:hypothetical protein